MPGSLLIGALKRHERRSLLAIFGILAGVACLTATGFAQLLPLEIRQTSTLWNFQSQRGVPISITVNPAIGSDGRMTNYNESGSSSRPTTNQFAGMISFGGIPGLSSNAWVTVSNSTLLKAGTNRLSGVVAEQMDLPRATSNGVVVMVLRRAQIGAPYLLRQSSFPFGSIVEAPLTDEEGLPLAANAPSAYWLPEPYTTSAHTNSGYYWSPHARKVYATQPGPLSIRWIKAAYTSTAPPDYETNRASYSLSGGNYFRLHTVNYTVSSSAVKTPRRIYWTERDSARLGKPILVPSARIRDVAIAYNNNFLAIVPQEYNGPGTNEYQIRKTLWYDKTQNAILAYNIEGRAFVEFLGDAIPGSVNNARVQLGYEIVDVFMQPFPEDVRIELGDRVTPPLPGSVEGLTPEPVLQNGTPTFAYQQNISGSEAVEIFATRETANQNDYLIHWMETGVVGLKWPALLGRYQFSWPTDVARYSHYVRPLVATEAEARLTAVALTVTNVPTIDWQDALDQPRAKLTENNAFYTFLDAAHPAHRTLLRFSSADNVAFERVFSWLDVNLKSGNFAGDPIATRLDAWNATSNRFAFPDPSLAPRVVIASAVVGERIAAPALELGAPGSGSYLAGHINASAGTLYNPNTYVDPLTSGFDAANLGAIIPVNAIPGKNDLEVWWFRRNAANTNAGFAPIYWPAVLGRYTIQWPVNPREIVLASKLGSGTLDPFETPGTIYFQNNLSLPGFNPNEEHALMQGGQAYALRDDLNITNHAEAGGYSSAPFVLLDYTASDNRPAMQVFKVLREKGAHSFNYQVEAGTILQPPMPLPLLDLPLGPKPAGLPPRSLNQETYFRTVAGSTTNGELATLEAHHFRPWFRELALQSPDLQTVNWFFATNADYDSKSLRGLVSTTRAFGVANGAQLAETSLRLLNIVIVTNLSPRVIVTNWTYEVSATVVFQFDTPDLAPVVAGKTVYLIAPAIGSSRAMTVRTNAGSYVEVIQSFTNSAVESLNAELSLSSPQVTNAAANLLQAFSGAADLIQATLLFVPSAGNLAVNQFKDWRLRTEPIPASGDTNHGTFTLQDRKGNIWVYRGPHQAGDQSWMAIQYYYKTLPGFFFPTLTLAQQPPAGTITPYLRNTNPDGTFAGDPVHGNRNNSAVAGDNNAFAVYYRPVWPAQTPELQMAETLTVPKHGLPAVRGQTSLQVIYQQSQVTNSARVTVRLHDPTREKAFVLGPKGGTGVLGAIPDSVKTEVSRGKTYFPSLPPHLSQRFFLDPNRGINGNLVFKGEFVDEIVGDKYLNLNLLSVKDATTLSNLCLTSDPARARWNSAIAGLSTKLEKFVESPQKPGTYVVAEGAVSVGPGELAEVTDDDVAVDSYALTAVGPGSGYVSLIAGDGLAFTPRAEPVSVVVLRVSDVLYPGELKIIQSPNPLAEQLTMQQVVDLAGKPGDFAFEWKIAAPVDGLPPKVYDGGVDRTDEGWVRLAKETHPDGIRTVLGGSADVRALTDNYVIMRYRAANSGYSPGSTNWSSWTTPQLAEGWIKRVLAGINPFNQRVKDFFNNQVNTDVSLLTQAGHRWEGDVALNLDSINSYGLIEIYETVLRRGRMLSIDGGINYGPANDALLLAAGYLNDLYMMVGNEAWADAANPTIGIGTANNTYGDIATALFAFKGQMPSLLEEELSLVRGRDDFLLPGVATAPVYNRLVWNYTRGIDAGEVIYAINYNIQENPNNAPDGVINAQDAARMFPQGHGDAYGHYLTALKGYYSLLLNQQFDWVPRIEAVTVLGQPVSVDYQDERKFAAAAAAVARAGRQVFDLTWRKDYQSGHENGWSHFAATRVNSQRPIPTTRYWGLDHWASRTGEGSYLHWVTGNAMLPAVDPNPLHEGIQKVDRTTVPELTELATMAGDLQTAMDNAEGGMTPLGLPQGSVALDINPNVVVGTDNGTHFEQIYGRAKVTLNNAVAAFDDAKDVTRLMRSEQDSLADFQGTVARQELAYNNALIELYGTPYTDDLGPGKTWKQGYTGPDLLNFAYTEMPQLTYPGLLTNTQPSQFRIDFQNYTTAYENSGKSRFDFVRRAADSGYLENTDYISFTLDSSGSFQKPAGWTGRRASPGKLQDAIARIQLARNGALGTLSDHTALKRKLDRSLEYFEAKLGADEALHQYDVAAAAAKTAVEATVFSIKMGVLIKKTWSDTIEKTAETTVASLPESTIVGLANGGDILSGARGALLAQAAIAKSALGGWNFAKEFTLGSLTTANDARIRFSQATFVGPLLRNLEDKQAVLELDATLSELQGTLFTINQRLQELDDAVRNYQTQIAQGERTQDERLVYRQRASAVVQGYRTRDAAFRIFRNEKLERYKTLFDQAARYAFLSANSYDYETGLLNTTAGRSFINRILSARALGVVRNGEPQYAGSATGDPGLSSALAEMKADWDVVKGRLGFNNPDAYGTMFSLRTENFRILPGTNSDTAWQDLLHESRKRDVLADADVRRHCLQLSRGNGLPVPGIIIEFSTTIADGYNFFGQPLAAGDHSFSPSSFATKIFGVGTALEGYRGMDQPAANGGAGGTSPTDPNTWFLDPLALSATPYVYLIPVGVDSMRSPPLGDASDIRSWIVDDVAIPLPFNIGASQLANGGLYQSADFLSEPLFTVRKHQAFRPVPSASFFSTSLYGQGGTLLRSQYTNNRLIGRSAWNSKWKLVIPGHTMLNDPDEGLDRFIKTVRDINLQFVTYSYSGN